ncbi:MAG: hypothetical protein IKU34_04725 [Clostridia bacterium]|nr:hypothetical protein [Clostridia bacterium]
MTALLVAVMTLLFSFQSLFCKLFSEKYDSGSAAMTSTVFSIAYGAFAGIATLLIAGLRFAPSGITLLCGLINAITLLVYNTAMIQASRSGSYSFQMICMLFGAIVLPLLHTVFFLGGSLSAMQLIAIAMMLVSFVLMNLKGLTLRGSSGRFFFWCAALFVSNGMYSIMLNLQQLSMQGAQRNEMIILSYLGMSLLYAAVQIARDKKALLAGLRMKKEPLLFLLLCCICATLAVHMVLYVLTLVDATVLYTIDNGGVLVLSVLYSRILFKEKLSSAQIAGIALAAVSIVMLSL